MGIFRFIRTPKPQRFEFIPRYYDPDKEDLQARLKAARQEGSSDDPEAMKSRISRGFRQKRSSIKGYGSDKDARRSNYILIGTLLVLIFLTYIFIDRYLPQFIQLFE